MLNSRERHIENVIATAESSRAAALSRLAASWTRSMSIHGLHPGERRAPERVDPTNLRERQQREERFTDIAAPYLDDLFGLVGQPGCCVLLSDAQGVILDQRINTADSDQFRDWGLWRGTDWSEVAEGTNGIGTCLVEAKQTVIHREQHFYARNTGMSCIDAPIFGPDGSLIGALDVSSARHDHTENLNTLIRALVQQIARQIEADSFRSAYEKARILDVPGTASGGAALLAVDQDEVVIGATRNARHKYKLGSKTNIEPKLVSEVLNSDTSSPVSFEKAERTAIVQALTQHNRNVSEAARALGIGRATIYRRMTKLAIDPKADDLSIH
ncbi:GAF domain-containing protein [Tateyamaria sp. SN3-11]|uniref:GAF domain-containing protein n=1 Tax=Tateyamaria sp. SN3-11 TaxID=3092147 RepID=UPI0039EBA97A